MKRARAILRSLMITGLLVGIGCQESPSQPSNASDDANKAGSRSAAASGRATVDSSAKSMEEDKSLVVATVNGQSIRYGDLLAEVGAELFKHRTESANKEYSIKRGGLDKLVETRLLEKEAAKKGLSVEEFLKKEIDDKVGEPSGEDLEQFFNQNRRRFPPSLTFEQAKPRLSTVWANRETTKLRTELLSGLKEDAKVEINLPFPDLPTVEVSMDDDPIKGNPDAPIKIIEFSDYQCPYCQRNVAVMKKIVETYGDKVAIVFRDFPLSFHDKAQKAAEAAQCAHEQGKYWEYHDYLFENQKALDLDNLKKAAEKLGLDTKKFNTCVDSDRYKEEVLKDMADGQALGVQGTPAVFINGKMVNGARPYESFESIIEAELARLGMQ